MLQAPPDPTRRSLREARRPAPGRGRAAIAPVAATLVAGLLVTGGAFANPLVAHAESVTATRTMPTTAASIAEDDSAATALFERTAERADERAATALAEGNALLSAVKGKVDTAPLTASLASLVNYEYLDTTTVQSLSTDVLLQSDTARNQAAVVDQAAADAAAQAAAEAAAAEQAAAERLALANTPDGARAVAADMVAARGWGSDQMQCLDSLWTKESGWNYQAENASSGAYGIPQSLPGSKMATVADDWATNAVTQITWGLDYIARGYGTPCSAWSHSQSVNWY
ncbi:hypothetical protein ACEXQD_17860 [Herbiconiux sp. P15]|uniref:aggregation-promoting factor C-terminal-like domain-containing protein n=1 Tax=Herbiconiux liukaitaii TaxID=3342799 RepID=UPI0035BA0BB0